MKKHSIHPTLLKGLLLGAVLLLAALTAQAQRYSYESVPGEYVSIDLFKAGSPFRTLRARAALGSDGKGSFTWRVPRNLPAGSDYRVVVTSTIDRKLFDQFFDWHRRAGVDIPSALRLSDDPRDGTLADAGPAGDAPGVEAFGVEVEDRGAGPLVDLAWRAGTPGIGQAGHAPFGELPLPAAYSGGGGSEALGDVRRRSIRARRRQDDIAPLRQVRRAGRPGEFPQPCPVAIADAEAMLHAASFPSSLSGFFVCAWYL